MAADAADLETLWEAIKEGDRATIEALLIGVGVLLPSYCTCPAAHC